MAVAEETRLIIVRYSEVGLKGNRARSMMINKLRSNILDGLDRIGVFLCDPFPLPGFPQFLCNMGPVRE